MTKPDREAMGTLRHIGPASRQMLIAAGIDSEEDLRAMGSVRAYLAVKRANVRASLNLLWALEAALTGKHWQVVAREDRTALLLELDDAEVPAQVVPGLAAVGGLAPPSEKPADERRQALAHGWCHGGWRRDQR